MNFSSRSILLLLALLLGASANAQVNTDQVIRIGQNALYFEDYMLSIQYFNQAIASRPSLAKPYLLRAIAKLNLDDYNGAEADASLAIERNPFIVDSYEVRGVARQNLGKLAEAVDDYTKALELLPENRNILFNRALAQHELGDTAAAAATYAHLLKAHPGYDNAYIGRAKLELEMADTTAALADIDKAIAINPSTAGPFVMRASIKMEQGVDSFPAALADMDQAIKLQPRHAGFFVNRAFLRYRLDDYFGAMADYDYAIQLDPLNDAALFNRGLLRTEVRDYDKAIRDFSEVLRLKPDEQRALYNRAMLYRDTHQWQRALDDINRVIASNPELPAAVYLRFDINREMGNIKAAQRDYDKAIALSKALKPDSSHSENSNPDLSDNQLPDSTVIARTAGRFSSLITLDNSADAIEQEYHNPGIRGKVQDRNINVEIEPMFAASYFASSTELKPNTYYIKEIDDINDTRILPQLLQVTNAEPAFTDEAEITRQFESKRLFDQAIAAGSPRAIDYFGRGMANLTLRNYPEAINDFTKAIELTPDLTAAWLQRGVARFKLLTGNSESDDTAAPAEAAASLRRKAYQQVVSDFDQAAKLSPTMAFSYYNKGVALATAGDYTSAIAALSDAIAAKPDLGEAYYNRGYVYLRLGNREAGLRDLSKAGELGIIPSYNLLKRMR